MRLIFSAFLFLLYSVAPAQDLTGIWRGHFKSANYSRLLDSLGIEDRYKFETQISQNNKAFEGVTYSYKTTVFYGKASCIGTISNKTKKVILGENRLLEVKSSDGGACLMTCFLQYSKVGEEEFLEGTYTSISVRDSTQCGGGTVFLRKVTTSDFYKEPFLAEKDKQKPSVQPPATKITPAPSTPGNGKTAPQNTTASTPKNNTQPKKPANAQKKPAAPPVTPKKPSQSKPGDVATAPRKEPSQRDNERLKQIPADSAQKEIPTISAPVPLPRVLATRKNELVKTIISSADQVSIRIYDNGTIDNDTVSVYIDNKLVISKQRLTDQPIEVKINLADNRDYHELVMVAENLGEIPPNTSLMVVTAGEERYEVRITSNEQKNAVVRFRRK